MKIKQITHQSRRDFWADLECEHCNHVQKLANGYDDSHFHTNVIPAIKCEECGEVAPSTFRAMAPKYSADTVV